MKISVISIFYNSGNYVKKCISSILSQRGDFELEVIAVDDASIDNTYIILSQYSDKRLKVIRHDKNRGISEARNTGLKNITGDCFFFIDGDDFLPDNALNSLAINFSSKIDWVQGAYSIFNESGDLLSIKKNPFGIYDNKDKIINNFNKIEFIYTHNRLVNSKLKDIFFPGGKSHEDRFWNVSAFPRVNYIVNIDIPTYCYISRCSSFSQKSRASEKYIQSGIELMHKMDLLDSCWYVISDTFFITAIEKNLYLWKQKRVFRKQQLKYIKLRNQQVRLNIDGFPKFTKLIHNLIRKNTSDLIICFIAFCYRLTKKITNKPV